MTINQKARELAENSNNFDSQCLLLSKIRNAIRYIRKNLRGCEEELNVGEVWESINSVRAVQVICDHRRPHTILSLTRADFPNAIIGNCFSMLFKIIAEKETLGQSTRIQN